MNETWDFIIVGAGSAGSVLADRLSADGKATVLVLEYGGSDNSIFIKMPSALSIPLNQKRFNWGYVSEPEPNLDNRSINTPRGKVIGGSSSINGLVYVRGNPRDFDRWQQEGAANWSYSDVLPYFRRSETRAEGGDAYRGDSGPLHTRAGKMTNPLYGAFLKAAREAGYPATADVNGYSQEGFGRARPDDLARAAVERGGCVSQAGGAAGERAGGDPRADDPDSLRRQAGGGCCLSPGWRGPRGAGKPRGDRGRRGDQLAAASEAVGDRAGGRTEGARDTGGRASRRCRREPAGPPRVLLSGGLEAAGLAVLVGRVVRARAGRGALAALS